jgi:NADPH:quinone reductase-like Zn-dependent oxidoreductase
MSTTPRNDLVLIRMHVPAGSARPIRFTGVVEAIGTDVTGLVPGDEVGGTASHVFGQYVCVPQRQLETIQEEE